MDPPSFLIPQDRYNTVAAQAFTAIEPIPFDLYPIKLAEGLHEDDVQGFIDGIDKALDDALEPQVRRVYLRRLSKVCSLRTLLPTSAKIPPCYNPTENPVASGGFADVWKGQHEGQTVAVKVIKIISGEVTREIISVSSLTVWWIGYTWD